MDNKDYSYESLHLFGLSTHSSSAFVFVCCCVLCMHGFHYVITTYEPLSYVSAICLLSFDGSERPKFLYFRNTSLDVLRK